MKFQPGTACDLRSNSPGLYSKTFTAVLCLLTCIGIVQGADRFEQPPVNYSKQQTHDPIARLQKQIDDGKATLEYDERHGYLPAVLKYLNIPVSSQMLVFSKTSFQQPKITPFLPRAIYFGDDAYIGWVQSGDVVEISAVDPTQGAIFYALEQKKVANPKFIRMTDRCLQCHASSLTQGVPGHLVRSVFTDEAGFPVFRAGTFRTDHRSKISNRWGGWYVTGTHGKQRHMGNVMAKDMDEPDKLEIDAGANITDLSQLINVTPYLTPHSDIVALMVMEHQVTMHNLITNANYEGRYALHYAKALNKALERPADYLSPSTLRRIHHAADQLLAYMLFSEEAAITEPIKGTSGFASDFTKAGLRDKKGRSLRDLDMKRRLFKYPCSYLIYSPAFDGLPPQTRKYIYTRLRQILTGQDKSKTFAHLSDADRKAIYEILRDTKKGLPKDW